MARWRGSGSSARPPGPPRSAEPMTAADAPGGLPAARLGRIVATEAQPSTPHQFRFDADPGAVLGIGSIVRVDHRDRTTYGVVIDGAAWGDEREPSLGGPTRRFTAAVLRQLPAEPLVPVAAADVVAATDADVAIALRSDAFTAGPLATGVPVGLYTAGGLEAPVHLDADFLLGPEAAHANLTGVSGLATKTSAITFLLSSIFQTFPAHRGTVAALCFNVKGPDLCFLDQPAPLGEVDRARYARMGLRAEAFRQVRYYAPCKPDGVNLNTLRTHAALAANTEPLTWGLTEVLDFAEVVLNRDDADAKADAFLDFLRERVVGKAYDDETLQPRHWQVASFADLEQFFRAIFTHLEAQRNGEVWRTHHVATIRKLRNRLGNISMRAQGLVTDDGAANDLPWGAFADRTVYVVDVAGLDPLAQDLVFARAVARLREHLERRDLGVDHVVVVVDELNKYAPADGQDTYVRRMLVDLAERGRYLGLVLFSAQQFRSQVLRRVTGNAGTAIFGRMDPEELATPGYQTLSLATKARLAALPKGELMVRHPHFTQPVFVTFPRPAMLAGREGVERFPPEPDLPFASAMARHLRQLGATVTVEQVERLLDGHRPDDARRALAAVRRARPEDPLAYFRASLGTRVEAIPPPRRAIPSLARGDDPYGA